jgi:hypothetical protein
VRCRRHLINGAAARQHGGYDAADTGAGQAVDCDLVLEQYLQNTDVGEAARESAAEC